MCSLSTVWSIQFQGSRLIQYECDTLAKLPPCHTALKQRLFVRMWCKERVNISSATCTGGNSNSTGTEGHFDSWCRNLKCLYSPSHSLSLSLAWGLWLQRQLRRYCATAAGTVTATATVLPGNMFCVLLTVLIKSAAHTHTNTHTHKEKHVNKHTNVSTCQCTHPHARTIHTHTHTRTHAGCCSTKSCVPHAACLQGKLRNY